MQSFSLPCNVVLHLLGVDEADVIGDIGDLNGDVSSAFEVGGQSLCWFTHAAAAGEGCDGAGGEESYNTSTVLHRYFSYPTNTAQG